MAGSFAAWRSRGAPERDAQRDYDRMLDIVIMISVVVFLLLAAGVGVLVLQNSLR
ncbi:MAG TPA: hypothetical protein VEL02_13750 [Jatrophihabitantaceae bacterium]|jgi:hypothetical protein|nr:hypothetical protein [Jatrophihabitantaceae bacterium]